MAVHIPANFGQLAFNYSGTAGTQPYVVTCGIALPTGVDLQEVVDFSFATWAERWMPNTFSEFTLENCTLTVNAPGGGLGSVISANDPVPGDADGAAGLVAAAVLVNKRTGQLGRKGRGRFFIPGLLGESDIDVTGVLSDSTVAVYATLAAAWLSLMQEGEDGWGASPNPYVLHSDASLTPSAINRLVVSPKVGILRKRLR